MFVTFVPRICGRAVGDELGTRVEKVLHPLRAVNGEKQAINATVGGRKGGWRNLLHT